jgi:hypothetical protein
MLDAVKGSEQNLMLGLRGAPASYAGPAMQVRASSRRFARAAESGFPHDPLSATRRAEVERAA